jgi:hypothetical protein
VFIAGGGGGGGFWRGQIHGSALTEAITASTNGELLP